MCHVLFQSLPIILNHLPHYSKVILQITYFSILSSRQRSDGSMVLLVDTNPDGEQSLLDEIFQFIGAKPEEAVSINHMTIM